MVDFIDRHKDVYGIEPICRVGQVAPSTYYAAKTRAPSVRTVRDAVLAPQLHRLVYRGVQADDRGSMVTKRTNIEIDEGLAAEANENVRRFRIMWNAAAALDADGSLSETMANHDAIASQRLVFDAIWSVETC